MKSLIPRLLILTAIVGGPQLFAADSASVRLIVDGTQLAQERLAADRNDEVGRDLVEFILALKSDYEPALLLLANIDDGMPIKTPESTVDPDGYADLLARFAEKFDSSSSKKSQLRGRLFWIVAKEVSPTHRDARVAVMKMKREGDELEFREVLATYTGRKSERRSSGSRSGDSAPAGESAAQVQNVLRQLRIGGTHYVRSYNPYEAVNNLNRYLQPHSIIIAVSSLKQPVTISNMSNNLPYYRPANSRSYSSNDPQVQLQDPTAEDLLGAVCSIGNFSYTIQGRRILLTDADGSGRVGGEATTSSSSSLISRTYTVKAAVLYNEFDNDRKAATEKYRDARLIVTGYIAEMEDIRPGVKAIRESEPRYLKLADGKVEIHFSDALSRATLASVVSTFKSYLENQKRYGDDYRYAVGVQCQAVFDEARSNRVVRKECTSLSADLVEPAYTSRY